MVKIYENFIMNENLGLETDLSFQEYNGPTRALGTRLIFINLQLILLNSIWFSCEANRQHGTNKFSSFCSDSLLFDMSQFRKVFLWQIEV